MMAKIVFYECDWCGVKQPPDGDEEWPRGWSNFDEIGNHDLLCDGCVAAARIHIEKAFDAAKAYRQRVAAEYDAACRFPEASSDEGYPR